MAGLYLEQGRDLVVEPSPEPYHQHFHPAKHKNRAFRQALSRGGPAPTTFAFGGNLALSASLMADVPFDPAITRGEDVDYVLSAWLCGHQVLLDPTILVEHYPPPRSHSTATQLLTDGLRFLAERRKMQCARDAGVRLPADWEDGYPGSLLTDDLPERLQAALGEIGGAAASQAATKLASASRELERRDLWQEYLDSRQCWRRLAARITSSARSPALVTTPQS